MSTQWLRIPCNSPARVVYVTIDTGIQYQPNTLQWRYHLSKLVRSPPVFDTSPNSQPLWTTTSSPNLLRHKTAITWLILPTFLSTQLLDVEGHISRQVGETSVTSWGEILMVNPGNFSCGLSKHLIESRAPRAMAGYPVRTNSQPTFTGLKNSSRSHIVTRFQGHYFLLRAFSTRTVKFLRQPSDITLSLKTEHSCNITKCYSIITPTTAHI